VVLPTDAMEVEHLRWHAEWNWEPAELHTLPCARLCCTRTALVGLAADAPGRCRQLQEASHYLVTR
jgi:hypothetical protein